MRITNKIVFALIIALNALSIKAQDSLYIYKDGIIIDKHELAGIDSITFQKAIPPVKNTVIDIDGNAYKTVVIGTQTWIAENLKTTKYSNGDLIGTTNPATLNILSETSPKYQWAFDGNENYATNYGRLYTWFAVNDARNVCPSGWHVPTDAEWTILTNYIASDGNSGKEGTALKSTSGWSDNGNGTNNYGFNALPSGSRFSDISNTKGEFGDLGSKGYWWSATNSSLSSDNAICRGIFGKSSEVLQWQYGGTKKGGLSVRCVKD